MAIAAALVINVGHFNFPKISRRFSPEAERKCTCGAIPAPEWNRPVVSNISNLTIVMEWRQ